MNRIILIGNGFDLAHGIKTSYGNFIDDYWENVIEKIRAKSDWENGFENNEFYAQPIPGSWEGNYNYEALQDNLNYINTNINLKNEFFEILNRNKFSQNWVDIENDYYILLKNCYKKSSSRYTITKLNKEFAKIESLLEEYLTKVQKEFSTSFPNTTEEMSFKRFVYNVIYSDFNFKELIIMSKILKMKKYHSDLELSEREIRLYQALINIKDKRQKIINFRCSTKLFSSSTR
jgi:hypothetical protein